MSNTTNTVKTGELGNIGTLVITKELQRIIDYLHYKVGSTEWSGMLFYKITKGNIQDMKDLEFTAEFLYPMDIGSGTYTEYEFSGEIVNAYDVYPNAMELSMGQAHSHHNMNTFFSGTDTDELITNAKLYNYYISLIVNFAHDYCAKIAFPSKSKVIRQMTLRDSDGKFFVKNIESEEEVIMIGNLEVLIEGETRVDDWLENRFKELKEKNDKKKSIVTIPQYQNNYLGKQYYDGFQDDDKWYDDRVFARTKPITKAQKFLNALAYGDSTKSYSKLQDALSDKALIVDDEMDTLAEQLEENLEVIHAEIYLVNSDEELSRHCLEALIELQEHELLYSENPLYQVLKETLVNNV